MCFWPQMPKYGNSCPTLQQLKILKVLPSLKVSCHYGISYGLIKIDNPGFAGQMYDSTNETASFVPQAGSQIVFNAVCFIWNRVITLPTSPQPLSGGSFKAVICLKTCFWLQMPKYGNSAPDLQKTEICKNIAKTERILTLLWKQ